MPCLQTRLYRDDGLVRTSSISYFILLLIANSKDYALLDDDEAVSAESSPALSSQGSSRKREGSSRGSGRDALGNYPKCVSGWLDFCVRDKKLQLVPSAKTIALKAQILKWLDEAPNEKILSKSNQ